MKLFFQPDDFKEIVRCLAERECLAVLANAKLEKLIKSWPVVYGHTSFDSWYETKEQLTQKRANRIARLAFIEELQKEPCKHEPELSQERMMFEGRLYPYIYKGLCKHCGVELIPEWKAK